MQTPKTAGGTQSKSRIRLALAAAGLLVIGLVLWLILDGDDPEKSSNGAEIVSADSLRTTAAEQATPVYWAGERQGTELELSREGGERTYLRYLTGGADAGDRRPDFLTVGTYAQNDPVATLRRQSDEPGAVLGRAPGNATVYFSQANPGSVYLAYPGVPVEIEVYDPNFKRALRLVNSGQIVAVG
ncbi:MAG: hypothetical protein QOF13_1321 [Solirubrobacterales bacterium]|jgi:hypothetical protein|nr:hypothetical protein [Solirubrobacterales bacterium]